MHQLLQDYTKRFEISPRTQSKAFFTQLSLEEYTQELPYLCDIQNFCCRLYQALLNKDKICIYSDYDTDAVTATGVMYWGLLDLGFEEANLDFYAPDRFIEGYGLNTESIEILSQNFDLIISVDCGINSVAEAEICLQNKCDLIITDHHHLHGEIPKALAVVNPRLAQFYNFQNTDPKITNLFSDNLTIQNWIKKTFVPSEEFTNNPARFLSQSVTGVGVAWFCLVWLAYFLEEVGEK